MGGGGSGVGFFFFSPYFPPLKPRCVLWFGASYSPKNTVVGEKNRELVDESKMGFLLLIEKSTESIFKIHFQIDGCLTEKILLLTQPAMPRHITDTHSQCILNPKFLACHSKLTYLAKINLKFFNH